LLAEVPARWRSARGQRDWKRPERCSVRSGMDDIEREAIRAEGLDPDDPAVIAAIDLVRWELSLGT